MSHKNTAVKKGPLPLAVSVTGHRDLRDQDLPQLEEKIRDVFREISARYPHTPLLLLSPLAEGADRMAARIGLEFGASLIAPLPLPRDLYEQDFETEASRREFAGLLEQADQWFEMPYVGDNTRESVRRVAHARTIIAVCGDDGTNAEIAAHAREVASEQPDHVLTCSTHIVDPELWYLLRKWEISMAGTFRLQFFNVFDISARALLESYPPFSARQSANAQKPHLLIVGGGRLGQSLVVHAARSWRDLHRSPEADANVAMERLRVTLIDRNTATIKDFLHLRHPELEEVCQIDTHTLDVDSPTFHRGAFLFNQDGECDVTQIYVCVDNDALGLSAALALHHRVGSTKNGSAGVPIVVRMTQKAGLATLLQGINEQNSQSQPFGTLHAVGLLEQSCQPDLVLGGTNEILARALHEKYLSEYLSDEHVQNGSNATTNPALLPWQSLSDEVKELNRSQANHISEKLRAIGCDIVPLADWNAAEFPFAPSETELMARMEHERWSQERRSQGWTYGPRDEKKKTNPSLLSWDELPDATREFNREAVREIPASLERAGFQIYRLQNE